MEQRLIDANAIKLEKGFFEKVDNVPKFYEWISKQPTVDAVPVVRCKDCKWACLAPQRQTVTCMKNRLPFTHDYDWFCADGERKEKDDATN